jgi:glycosyltransferase involved in cell wall biosynthesis
MPVYNEAETIREIVAQVLAVPIEKEILIVDDGSTDGTREILSRLDAAARQATGSENSFQVIYQPYNRGKGAAVRTGLERVTGDVVIIQDADLEYDPEDYAKLLDPILTDKADVVYGTRFAGGGAHRVLFFWHSLGNRMLTLISNALTNLNLSDMEVGYKVFRSEVLKRIKLKSDRFGFEPEITMKVAKQGCRIYEVPISYHGRTYAEGKKITWRDGIAALYCLIRFRLSD